MHFKRVGGSYFTVMETPILAGRMFDGSRYPKG